MEPVEGNIVPVITIQCDWEDFINVPFKRIWVSCKFLNQPSKHGKIVCSTIDSETDEFSAILGHNSICVRYIPTNHLCRFIPASKMFSDIHKKAILSLHVNEGGLGVSVCRDNILTVWDNNTGEVLRTLRGHPGDVYKCRFLPSSCNILSGGADMSLKVWSAETGECLKTILEHNAPITDFCFDSSVNNDVAVTASKNGIMRIWNSTNATSIGPAISVELTINCCCVGYCPEDLERRTGSLQIPETRNKIIILGSEEGFICGVVAKDVSYRLSVNSPVNAILFVSKDKSVAGLHDGRIIIIHPQKGKITKVIHESNSPVLCLALFRDNGVLIGRRDGTISYLGLFTDTSDRVQLTGSNWDPIYDISINKKFIYVACRDGKVRRYKVADLIAGGV